MRLDVLMPLAQRLGIANGPILEMMVHPAVSIHGCQHALRRRNVTAGENISVQPLVRCVSLDTCQISCLRRTSDGVQDQNPILRQLVRTILEETIVIAYSDMLKHPNADDPFVLGGLCEYVPVITHDELALGTAIAFVRILDLLLGDADANEATSGVSFRNGMCQSAPMRVW